MPEHHERVVLVSDPEHRLRALPGHLGLGLTDRAAYGNTTMITAKLVEMSVVRPDARAGGKPHRLSNVQDDNWPGTNDVDVTTSRFRDAVVAAGVKRIRLHDLRHTSAVIGLRELGELSWVGDGPERVVSPARDLHSPQIPATLISVLADAA